MHCTGLGTSTTGDDPSHAGSLTARDNRISLRVGSTKNDKIRPQRIIDILEGDASSSLGIETRESNSKSQWD